MSHVNNELVVLTDFDLEHSFSAGFNRMLCYANALHLKDVLVKIFSTRYSYKNGLKTTMINDKLLLIKGYKKKEYKSTFEDFHFLRILLYFININRILEKQNQARIVILLYHSTLATSLFCILYFRLFKGYNIFIEKNELKTAIILNLENLNRNIFRAIGLTVTKYVSIGPSFISDLLPVFYNGIIVISNRMFKLYSIMNRNIIKIPILVNPDNYIDNNAKKNEKHTSHFTIGYFGTLNEKKDGLLSLIESILNLQNPNVSLLVYGPGNQAYIQKLESLSRDNPSIIYYGVIDSKEVIEQLPNCNLLAMPRPKNMQTDFGLSTKLGEYLMSKIPVLTTDVSDNAQYINDNVNGFIIKTGKTIPIKNLVERLNSILKIKPETMRQIGYAGYETAIKNFLPSLYTDRLYSFLFPY